MGLGNSSLLLTPLPPSGEILHFIQLYLNVHVCVFVCMYVCVCVRVRVRDSISIM